MKIISIYQINFFFQRFLLRYEALGFFDEELKVENNENLSDIVTSEVWNDFYNMFEDNPHGLGLPFECIKFCGAPYIHNLINSEVA